MTEMSMNKAIHAAVRRDLTRFVGALGTFPDGDRRRARQLGAAWANFEDQLEHHHHGEHDFAWPALTALGVSPSVLAEMDSEHDVMAAALADAREAMATLVETASNADLAAAAMLRLQDVTVAHLEHEEAETEPVLMKHRGSEELKEMGRKFGKVSPMRAGRFLAWVVDGATEEERQAATDSIPGPVVALVGGVFGLPYRRNVAPAWRS